MVFNRYCSCNGRERELSQFTQEFVVEYPQLSDIPWLPRLVAAAIMDEDRVLPYPGEIGASFPDRTRPQPAGKVKFLSQVVLEGVQEENPVSIQRADDILVGQKQAFMFHF